MFSPRYCARSSRSCVRERVRARSDTRRSARGLHTSRGRAGRAQSGVAQLHGMREKSPDGELNGLRHACICASTANEKVQLAPAREITLRSAAQCAPHMRLRAEQRIDARIQLSTQSCVRGAVQHKVSLILHCRGLAHQTAALTAGQVLIAASLHTQTVRYSLTMSGACSTFSSV